MFSPDHYGQMYATLHPFRHDLLVSLVTLSLSPLFGLTKNLSVSSEIQILLNGVHVIDGDTSEFTDGNRGNVLMPDDGDRTQRLYAHRTAIPDSVQTSDEKDRITLELLSHALLLADAGFLLCSDAELQRRQLSPFSSPPCRCDADRDLDAIDGEKRPTCDFGYVL